MKRILFAACAAVIFLAGCKKTADAPFEENLPQDAVYKYIRQLGYRPGEIADKGPIYLVDGDIAFDKNNPPRASNPDGPQTEQYGTGNLVGYFLQPAIRVRIDGSMAGFATEINAALDMWNNVANCRLKFVVTTAGDQQILITNENLGGGFCGVAYFPANGNPGSLVRINGGLAATLSVPQRVSLIAHELGHCIGFRHTNWQPNGEGVAGTSDNGAYYTAMQILGTPTGQDVNSVMNGASCGAAPEFLSAFDILAMQFLYPANAPVPDAVPIFRYVGRHTRSLDHFYTSNYNDLGNGSNNAYVFEGVGFFAFGSAVTGSTPVYRYYNNNNGDHFYTTNFSELGGGGGGYVYEGIRFYAYASATNGAVPVYRYYNNARGDHFYTKNPNEFVTGAIGYSYESIAFYAH